jgi:hypothetical protein
MALVNKKETTEKIGDYFTHYHEMGQGEQVLLIPRLRARRICLGELAFSYAASC